jgi:predicted transglutaminase-like cysteine proteinase
MILRLICATLALALSAPAVPQTHITIPVDSVARAKFPRERGEFIDALAEINRFVNTHIEGVSDMEHYGVEDFWVMAPADGKGDCEDYVLTKLFLLQQAGVPVVTNIKIVGVIVHRGNDREGHAVLAVRLPKGEVLYMDNMNPEPMTRKELVRQGYQFFDWRA